MRCGRDILVNAYLSMAAFFFACRAGTRTVLVLPLVPATLRADVMGIGRAIGVSVDA